MRKCECQAIFLGERDDGVLCNDGNHCKENDVCLGGVCTGGTFKENDPSVMMEMHFVLLTDIEEVSLMEAVLDNAGAAGKVYSVLQEQDIPVPSACEEDDSKGVYLEKGLTRDHCL